MKLLITGSAGFIGSSLYGYFAQKGVDLIGLDIKVSSTVNLVCDLSKQNTLHEILLDADPDVIIHCAAIKDILKCETQKDLAWTTNVKSTSTIVQYVAQKPCKKVVYLSSDMIFDGKKGGYIENDLPNPINWYGTTKFHSELLIKQLKNFAICRTALVVDCSKLQDPSLVEAESRRRILRNQSLFPQYVGFNLSQQRKIYLPDDVISSPTHLDLINLSVEKIVFDDYKGVFHVAGSEAISRFAFAKRIAYFMGLDDSLVLVNNRNASAIRPKNIGLNVSNTYKKMKLCKDDWGIIGLLKRLDLGMC